MLRRGDLIPHFDVTTIEGRRFRYADIWQRRNLVLFALSEAPGGDAARRYFDTLRAHLQLAPQDATLVVFESEGEVFPTSMLIVADRWGEIVHVETLSPDSAAWPAADSVLEWVEFVRIQCPECPP